MADAVPPPPGPRKPPPPSSTYFSCPLLTIAASWETVGAGSPPLKPPIVTTGLPVAMMIGAALPDPEVATRYLAEPWGAGRYWIGAVGAVLWSPPKPPRASADVGPAVTLLPF